MAARVAIFMGSENDYPGVMEEAYKALKELGVDAAVHVTSAHRTPGRTHELVNELEAKGVQVFICGAGAAAHLAGVVASLTSKPVLGVPIGSSDLKGVDALYSTVMMPPGIPVAALAIGKGGARNAGILAAQILALSDPALAGRLEEQRANMKDKVAAADASLQSKL